MPRFEGDGYDMRRPVGWQARAEGQGGAEGNRHPVEISDGEDDDPRRGGPGGPTFDDLVLLEPLLRASARGGDAMERAHRLLEDLRDEEGKLPQLSEEFMELWRVVWEGSRA